MPAYTFRSVGAIDYDTNAASLTPGAPSGKATGDLLLLYTAERAGAQTITDLSPNWTQLGFDNADSWSFYIWGRIADGSANDTPTVTWTGTTADCAAWIEAYYGDVYTDLSTIVAHSDTSGNQATELSVLRLPTLTITTDNCLVVAMTMRQKSNTSNDATTITAAGGLTKNFQHIQSGTGAMMLVSAYMQQTTATNYDGSDFTRDGTDENQPSTGCVLALKTAASALDPIRLKWRM
jgi:hypothetical protein